MRRNSRQDAINRLREQNTNSLFDDRFDRHFDKALDNPVGFFAKFGILVIVLNFLFWGGLIALVFVLLNVFGVI